MAYFAFENPWIKLLKKYGWKDPREEVVETYVIEPTKKIGKLVIAGALILYLYSRNSK